MERLARRTCSSCYFWEVAGAGKNSVGTITAPCSFEREKATGIFIFRPKTGGDRCREWKGKVNGKSNLEELCSGNGAC